MNIPSQIRITARVKYQVAWMDVIENNINILGLCDPNSKTIFLKSGMNEVVTLSTFLHEVLHAISFESIKLDLTERQVLLLEKGLMRVAKLNKII